MLKLGLFRNGTQISLLASLLPVLLFQSTPAFSQGFELKADKSLVIESNDGLGSEVTDSFPHVNPSDLYHSELVAFKAHFEREMTRSADQYRVPFNVPFFYTIDRFKFLGEPTIAKLPVKSQRFNYYLLVFHFNIPAIQPQLLPLKFDFARIGARIIDTKDGTNDFSKDGTLQYARILSIYPQNELLTVDRTEENKLSVQFKPEFHGGSAGSVSDDYTVTNKYSMQLPKVVGTTSHCGDAYWTYYPARAQPLILGTKTTYAIIAVSKTDSEFTRETSIADTVEHNTEVVTAKAAIKTCTEALKKRLETADDAAIYAQQKAAAAARDPFPANVKESELALVASRAAADAVRQAERSSEEARVAEKKAESAARTEAIAAYAEAHKTIPPHKVRLYCTFDYKLARFHVIQSLTRTVRDVMDLELDSAMDLPAALQLNSNDLTADALTKFRNAFALSTPSKVDVKAGPKSRQAFFTKSDGSVSVILDPGQTVVELQPPGPGAGIKGEVFADPSATTTKPAANDAKASGGGTTPPSTTKGAGVAAPATGSTPKPKPKPPKNRYKMFTMPFTQS